MISIISLTLALTASVSALVPHSNHFARHAIHARSNKPKPDNYTVPYLEPYKGYHCRYLSLGCQDKHNTTFFSDCCHPLLSSQSLEKDRPKNCQPPSGPCPDDPSVKTPFDDQFDHPAPPAQKDNAKAGGNSPPDNKAGGNSPPDNKAGGDPPKAKGDGNGKNDNNNADAAGGGSVNKGGFATFFFQHGVAGACGSVHQDSDMIAAMDTRRYGNTGGASSLCGKKVKINNAQNGQSVVVTVADACPTCKNSNSIDLSQGAFNQIAKPEQGMVPIEWTFV